MKKPKHHFAEHVSVELHQYGPPWGYWCFGFEAFNQQIKRAARRSNFKNETVSIMRYWSMKSARELVRAGRRAVGG